MKQQKLSALNHADPDTLEKIAQTYPAMNERELERMLLLSEQKYQNLKEADTFQAAESETYQVKNTKGTGWYHAIAAAAACLLVTAGAVGGIINMKRVQPAEEVKTAESAEIQTEPESTAKSQETRPQPKQTELSVKETETHIEIVPETQEATEPETKAESAMISLTSETSEPVMTTVQSMTETFPATETEIPEVPVIQDETEAIESTPVIIETIPENIPVIIETAVETVPETLEVTEPETEIAEDSSSSGFVLNITRVGEIGVQDYLYELFAVEDENVPSFFDTLYEPTYLPKGWGAFTTDSETIREYYEALRKTELTPEYDPYVLDNWYSPVNEEGTARRPGSYIYFRTVSQERFASGTAAGSGRYRMGKAHYN